jgi:ankyrin repeat protein
MVEELGADVNGTHDGATPLLDASLEGHLEFVRCLVRTLGADVNKASATVGASALYVAAQSGHLELLRCLIKDLGAFVNEANCQGCTPIMIVAEHGYADGVRCFGKEHGANVNMRNLEGATALIFASEHGHLEFVKPCRRAWCRRQPNNARGPQRAHDGIEEWALQSHPIADTEWSRRAGLDNILHHSN